MGRFAASRYGVELYGFPETLQEKAATLSKRTPLRSCK
jgi:hypothetical protein